MALCNHYRTRGRMKRLLKTIPSLVSVVRGLRSISGEIKLSLAKLAVNSLMKTRIRRHYMFEALPGPYALAQHPKESYLVNARDEVIGRALFSRGDFDFAKFELASKLIYSKGVFSSEKQNPLLLDIGANIGSICIPAVARGIVGGALAFEPDHENFRLLRINTLLNGVDDKIELHHAAVGDQRGYVRILRSATNSGDHHVEISDEAQDGLVPMVALDDFAEGLDLTNVIVWMDIQGFEGFALAGARQFSAAGAPLILEIYKKDLVDAGSYDILISILSASNYTSFYDLNDPAPEPQPLTESALHALADRLEAQNTFTDLLFLADG